MRGGRTKPRLATSDSTFGGLALLGLFVTVCPITKFICRPPDAESGRRLSLSSLTRPMAAVSKDAFRIQKFRTLPPGRSPLSPSPLPRQKLPARRLHLHCQYGDPLVSW